MGVEEQERVPIEEFVEKFLNEQNPHAFRELAAEGEGFYLHVRDPETVVYGTNPAGVLLAYRRIVPDGVPVYIESLAYGRTGDIEGKLRADHVLMRGGPRNVRGDLRLWARFQVREGKVAKVELSPDVGSVTTSRTSVESVSSARPGWENTKEATERLGRALIRAMTEADSSYDDIENLCQGNVRSFVRTWDAGSIETHTEREGQGVFELIDLAFPFHYAANDAGVPYAITVDDRAPTAGHMNFQLALPSDDEALVSRHLSIAVTDGYVSVVTFTTAHKRDPLNNSDHISVCADDLTGEQLVGVFVARVINLHDYGLLGALCSDHISMFYKRRKLSGTAEVTLFERSGFEREGWQALKEMLLLLREETNGADLIYKPQRKKKQKQQPTEYLSGQLIAWEEVRPKMPELIKYQRRSKRFSESLAGDEATREEFAEANRELERQAVESYAEAWREWDLAVARLPMDDRLLTVGLEGTRIGSVWIEEEYREDADLPAPAASQHSRSPGEVAWNFCPGCGAAFEADWSFCMNCGQRK